MNKLFYGGFLILVLSIIGLIVANNEQAEIVMRESVSQNSVQTDLQRSVKEIVFQQSDNAEGSNQINCLIDKGVIIEGNCEQFANLDKMDLEKYTNLRLHADFEQMLLNSRFNSLPELYSLFIELGKSDQGLVYQLVSFIEFPSEPDLDGEKKVNYLFNSRLNNFSVNVLYSDLIKDMDAKNEALLREDGFFKEPGSPLYFECVFKNQNKIFIENGYVLENYEICKDFPIEDFYSDIEFEEEYIDSLEFENGGSVEDFTFNEKCAFEYYTNIESAEYVRAFTCFDLTEEDNVGFEGFVNVKRVVIRGDSVDLNFMNNYLKVEKIELYNIKSFNAGWLSNNEKLNELTISDSNIMNIEALNSARFQLKNIKIHDSSVGNLDFLSSQYQLESVDLSNMSLNKMPEIGSLDTIETLIMKNNELKNLNGINNFSKLSKLDVRRNKIKYMSQINLENGVLKNFNITFNPLDCEDSALYYSPIVKSSCNTQLKKQLQ